MNRALKPWIETANTWLAAVFVFLLFAAIIVTAGIILISVFVLWLVMLVITFPVYLWELIKK